MTVREQKRPWYGQISCQRLRVSRNGNHLNHDQHRVRGDHSERPRDKERSARNSESEVNSNRGVSLGRQGRLDYVNFGTYVPPHLSRCPKFF